LKGTKHLLFFIIAIVIFLFGGVFNLYYYLILEFNASIFFIILLLSVLIEELLLVLFFKADYKFIFLHFLRLIFLYPFSLLFSFLYLSGNIEDDEVSDPFYMGKFQNFISFKDSPVREKFNAIPLKFILAETENSNSSAKKRGILNLKKNILNTSNYDFLKKHIQLLKLARSDDHPDVALYASDSITEIEEFFEGKIAKLHKQLPEKTDEFAQTVIAYLNSGISLGEISKYMAKDTLHHLKMASENGYNKLDYYTIGIKLLSSAALTEETEEFCKEAYAETNELSFLKTLGILKLQSGYAKEAGVIYKQYKQAGGGDWFESRIDS
jgi:hypothetical protein